MGSMRIILKEPSTFKESAAQSALVNQTSSDIIVCPLVIVATTNRVDVVQLLSPA